jgi:hypothetical protein
VVTSAGCLPKSVMPTASMRVRVPKPTFCKTAALYARGHVKSQMCRSFPASPCSCSQTTQVVQQPERTAAV